MPKGWQSNGYELHRTHLGACWAMWTGPDKCEIREVRYPLGHMCTTEYLGPDREWHASEPGYVIPPSHVLDARGAMSLGVEPLAPGVHIRDPGYDRCLVCHEPGRSAYGPCPGFATRPVC